MAGSTAEPQGRSTRTTPITLPAQAHLSAGVAVLPAWGEGSLAGRAHRSRTLASQPASPGVGAQPQLPCRSIFGPGWAASLGWKRKGQGRTFRLRAASEHSNSSNPDSLLEGFQKPWGTSAAPRGCTAQPSPGCTAQVGVGSRPAGKATLQQPLDGRRWTGLPLPCGALAGSQTIKGFVSFQAGLLGGFKGGHTKPCRGGSTAVGGGTHTMTSAQ